MMKMLKFVLVASLMFVRVNPSVIEALEIDNQQIEIDELDHFNAEEVWGPLLEDYVTTNNNKNREPRVLKIIPTSEDLITDEIKQKQPTNEQKESKISSGHKIVNNGAYTYPSTINNLNNVKPKPQSHQVTETDLYLLGAIEKLVYRADFMEKRLRRLEEMLFYTMAGNRIDSEPCSNNFTRVASGCYLFASNAGREGDWKIASKHCHRLGTHLVEFDTPEEYKDVVTFIQNTSQLRGKDFWTGGLNPGLLWIWSNSGRPIYTSRKSKRIHSANASNLMRVNVTGASKKHTMTAKSGEEDPLSASIRNAGAKINGQGPCLRLEHDQKLKMYTYKGTDCSVRYNYICEQGDVVSSNQIRRLGKSRKILLDEL